MNNDYANPQHKAKAESIMRSFNLSSLSSEAIGYKIIYEERYYQIKLKIKVMKHLFSHSLHKL